MEVKILDVDVEVLQLKLSELKAKKVFDDIRIITYFKNQKDNREPFLKLTEEGEKLKISSQNNQTHEEVKLFISRKDECTQLLATLGCLPISEVKAHRISYELGTIDFDVDEFPGIPPFLEIDLGENPSISFEELVSQFQLQSNKKGQYSTPEIVAIYGKNYFNEYKIASS